MSAKSTRAARSPRATTPKDGRPWYAPRPRWFADDVGPGLLMRREPQRYVVREIARCNSTYRAEQLAAALNREEKQQAELESCRNLAKTLQLDAIKWAVLAGFYRRSLGGLLAALRDVPLPAETVRAFHAAKKSYERLDACRTFKPGGEEVGRD